MALLDAELEGAPVRAERSEDLADVFREYAPAVEYFFSRRGFPREDCRDLTQETFLKAFRGLPRFRDEAELRTWILRIAMNVYRNNLRWRHADKRRQDKTVALEAVNPDGESVALAEDELLPRSSENPLEIVLENEGRRMLRDAVAELPPQMRRCVQLRIDQSLKYREIAAIMKVSVDTVKTQLHQARRRLKDDLDPYFTLNDDEE